MNELQTTRVIEEIVKTSTIALEDVVRTINTQARHAHASQPSFIASEQALDDTTSYLESCYLGVYAFTQEKFKSYLNETVPTTGTSGSYKSQYINILRRLREMGFVRTRLNTLIASCEKLSNMTDEMTAVYEAAKTCLNILKEEYGAATRSSNKFLNT